MEISTALPPQKKNNVMMYFFPQKIKFNTINNPNSNPQNKIRPKFYTERKMGEYNVIKLVYHPVTN